MLSRHAGERVLERTGLSLGQVLDRLNAKAFVWLPRRNRYEEQFALFYDGAADQYFVAVIAKGTRFLKTVVTVVQWERKMGRQVDGVWYALARTATAQALAAPAPDVSAIVPASVRPLASLRIEVLLRDNPHTCGTESRPAAVLGQLTFDKLVEWGLVQPDAVRVSKFLARYTDVLEHPAFDDWLLERLRPHADTLSEHTELLFRIHWRHSVRFIDVTEALVRLLTTGTCTPEAPEGEPASEPCTAGEWRLPADDVPGLTGRPTPEHREVVTLD